MTAPYIYGVDPLLDQSKKPTAVEDAKQKASVVVAQYTKRTVDPVPNAGGNTPLGNPLSMDLPRPQIETYPGLQDSDAVASAQINQTNAMIAGIDSTLEALSERTDKVNKQVSSAGALVSVENNSATRGQIKDSLADASVEQQAILRGVNDVMSQIDQDKFLSDSARAVRKEQAGQIVMRNVQVSAAASEIDSVNSTNADGTTIEGMSVKEDINKALGDGIKFLKKNFPEKLKEIRAILLERKEELQGGGNGKKHKGSRAYGSGGYIDMDLFAPRKYEDEYESLKFDFPLTKMWAKIIKEEAEKRSEDEKLYAAQDLEKKYILKQALADIQLRQDNLKALLKHLGKDADPMELAKLESQEAILKAQQKAIG